MELRILSTSDVLRVYEHLVEEFMADGDPIAPAGVRDEHLLGSAVGRQVVTFAGQSKYTDPVECAATLGYGICKNHPFFNGNKRAALVAILVHLDANKLSLWGTGQDELYDMMLAVAEGGIAEWAAERLGREIEFLSGESSTDVELRLFADWLKSHVGPVKRGDRSVRYRDLKKLIQKYGYDLQNPSGNFIHVVKVDDSGTTTNVDTIVFAGMKRDADVQVVKRVRERCRIREEDGVDAEAFYNDYLPIDEFINKYRLVLRRLAET